MRRAATGTAALCAAGVLASCSAGAVEMPAPTPGPAAEQMCRALVDRLPQTLFDQDRVGVRPETPYATAWGDPPIALRCGVGSPAGLRPDSQLTVVNEIAWLPGSAERPELFTAVGREAYVEMTVPASYGAPAEGLVKVSNLIKQEIPALPPGEL
ncbi:DUF3515 domain-containing protein [Streptomonospora wellingtoniae]|uniref:DUF3515 domain-containing protein n=1 Tax=Streptomonospora wellingtoniae TaxID=3075544 RepID=A0ABU2KZU3_9ACTN|nr:DUF3515 domain-containing protein [Streptomonospora sp. DSM 45055]MDT0304691.1 DUF3515 domain-containing protein [Streptomonospora sp. DSM 45055]